MCFFFMNIRSQHYFILLIFTNGIISDFQTTFDEVKKSTTAPISIILVGVGDGDFSLLE